MFLVVRRFYACHVYSFCLSFVIFVVAVHHSFMSKTRRKTDRCVFLDHRRQEKAPLLVLYGLRGESSVALPDGLVKACVHVRHSTKIDAHKSTDVFVLRARESVCEHQPTSLLPLRVFAAWVLKLAKVKLCATFVGRGRRRV